MSGEAWHFNELLIPSMCISLHYLHSTLKQCWVNVGRPSTTSAQHWSNIGSMPRVFWVTAYVMPCLHLIRNSLTYKFCSSELICLWRNWIRINPGQRGSDGRPTLSQRPIRILCEPPSLSRDAEVVWGWACAQRVAVLWDGSVIGGR